LRRTLRAAGDDLSDLKRAHAEAAGIVTPVATAKAPRRSGRLASTVRGAGTKTAALIRAGFAAVPYAGVQEWGWPAHSIAAQPFVVPAAQETEPTWLGAYESEVDRILGQVKGT
jgi:hypothetical protein